MRFWRAGLVNLLFATALTAVCFLDVLVMPFAEWKVGEPAPSTYRWPATHATMPEEYHLDNPSSPSYRRFITRRGKLVIEANLEDLNRLIPERRQLDPRRAGGVLAFIFLALTFFNLVLRRYRQHLLLRFRAVFSMYLALLVTVVACRLLLSYTTLSVYALPVALGGLLFAPLISQNIAFVLHLLSVTLVAPMIGITRGVVLIPLVCGWAAILLIKRESGPVRLLLAAVAGAAAGGLFLVGLDLFTPQGIDFRLHLEGDLTGLAGAMLASGLLAGLIGYPVARMFGSVPLTKVRKLLEMDRPLLKDLAEKAPGTFQHSLAMANMAEKIADDIGADSDLVRVGAYYHDIGKMHLPTYFIENQQGENPHDKLSPQESVTKLRTHVQSGVTIARGADLPDRVIDFIIEHHGRSTMEYFMDKAYQTNGKVPSPEEFSYKGRNPTSRETAILMIVDSIEAASRTLKDPTQDQIENLVRRIIFSKLLHGYLDDSGLTTGDLRQVGISAIKFLQAQFHVRVVYPWQKKDNERPPLQVVADTHSGIQAASGSRVAQPVNPPDKKRQDAGEGDQGEEDTKNREDPKEPPK